MRRAGEPGSAAAGVRGAVNGRRLGTTVPESAEGLLKTKELRVVSGNHRSQNGDAGETRGWRGRRSRDIRSSSSDFIIAQGVLRAGVFGEAEMGVRVWGLRGSGKF